MKEPLPLILARDKGGEKPPVFLAFVVAWGSIYRWRVMEAVNSETAS